MIASKKFGISGFTLVELLMVIAVVAILVSILSAASLSAKRRMKSTMCIGNLHQHGILLGHFTADHGEYPLYMNDGHLGGAYQEHRSSWMGALHRESLGSNFQDSTGEVARLLDCPSAPRPKTYPRKVIYMEYGYNSDGLIGRIADFPTGIGGKGTRGIYTPPVPESEVKNPAQMIAIGDGFLGWNETIRDGLGKIGRTFGSGAVLPSTRRARERHHQKANILFCDGHVAPITFDFLFVRTDDEALKWWNRDNLPHKERVR